MDRVMMSLGNPINDELERRHGLGTGDQIGMRRTIG